MIQLLNKAEFRSTNYENLFEVKAHKKSFWGCFTWLQANQGPICPESQISQEQPIFVFLLKNENPNFQSQAFRSFVKIKLKANSSTRGDFINGQTHKKTGRH